MNDIIEALQLYDSEEKFVALIKSRFIDPLKVRFNEALVDLMVLRRKNMVNYTTFQN
jgi:hypothetical protein